MKKIRILLALLAVCSTSLGQNKKGTVATNANENKKETMNDKIEIEGLIKVYNEAINASDAAGTIALYTVDSTLLPNGASVSRSRQQLNTTYQMLFGAFVLGVEYIVDEIVISGDFAVARTHSNGETTVLASNAKVPIDNKEIFIFRKDNGKWMISHYMFNANKMK